MSKIDSTNSKKTLFLDIGNSSIKAAFKKGGKWQKASDNFKSVTYLISWLNNHTDSIGQLVVGSVRKDQFDLLQNQVNNLSITHIRIEDIPIAKLDYNTPKTLGVDRYLGCLGAFKKASKAVVVIDAGSACTIDLMDKQGVYQGGVIMPGLQSLMNIFKISAPELPAIETEIPSKWPGKSTTDSLKWGQVGFFIDGIEAALNRYKNQHGDFELFITGGDAEIISTLIPTRARKNDFLIFNGMEAFIDG